MLLFVNPSFIFRFVKHRLQIAGKIILWLVVVLCLLKFMTSARDNSYAISPSWFSGDKNSCGEGCKTMVAYSNIGFPIAINGSSTSGPYWLAWLINLSVVAIVATALAWLLIKWPRK